MTFKTTNSLRQSLQEVLAITFKVFVGKKLLEHILYLTYNIVLLILKRNVSCYNVSCHPLLSCNNKSIKKRFPGQLPIMLLSRVLTQKLSSYLNKFFPDRPEVGLANRKWTSLLTITIYLSYGHIYNN